MVIHYHKRISAFAIFLTFFCHGMEEPKLSPKQQQLFRLFNTIIASRETQWDKIIEENKVGPAAFFGGTVPIGFGAVIGTHAVVSLVTGNISSFFGELILGATSIGLGYKIGEKLCRSEHEAIKCGMDDLFIANNQFLETVNQIDTVLTQNNLHNSFVEEKISIQIKYVIDKRKKQLEHINNE
ncbi:MAG: hypothetical protein BWY54_00449 [Candidatus Dependentiae bacterium ADurb.Bin331]|nr:MAG: hypothetical protein BWY54_00449 [Candidatus Dependentiae bacterium ADurb.Bin331]